MKKYLKPATLVTLVILVLLLMKGADVVYTYFSGPKILDSVLTKSIDDSGEPNAPTSTFTSNDTVYFSAKGKKLAIRKATVVWYKGEITTTNRFKVEENIELNSSGYFSANLSFPEGLEVGLYGVSIYNAGNDILETTREFYIKN